MMEFPWRKNKDPRVEFILKAHRRWLEGKRNGIRADFSGQIVSGYDFKNAKLRKACFRCANLSYVDFRLADLMGADFSFCVLNGVDFRDAFLGAAKFYGAINLDRKFSIGSVPITIRGADFRGAYMCDADFRRADMAGALLDGANLSGVRVKGTIGLKEE
jgi:uncharacterized protein YjbI with pentapeptide repeats